MDTFIRPIPNELQEVAKKELNETPTRIIDGLKCIKEWLQMQPHLKCRTDDQWLLSFLRGCKFSLERTKERINNFYTMRNYLPELSTNRDPFEREIQEVLNSGSILPLPRSINDTGPKIVLITVNNARCDAMSLFSAAKTLTMIFDILLLEDDNFNISGMWNWFDCKDLDLKYLFQMTPTFITKAGIYAQDGYPTRNKALHFTNTPSALESVFNIVKSIINAKLKDRLYVYSEKNIEKFNEILPLEYRPKEYGGENGSIEDIKIYWKKKVESYKDWFLDDSKYGIDETLRPLKSKTSFEIFGMEGTFRKLDID